MNRQRYKLGQDDSWLVSDPFFAAYLIQKGAKLKGEIVENKLVFFSLEPYDSPAIANFNEKYSDYLHSDINNAFVTYKQLIRIIKGIV